jgi:NAD-reducing hydrogenase large subunit
MMTKRILIDPVTRIEGHAKITIHLNDEGQVDEARFHVAEFRGFERMMQGRPLWEMPAITARICGICPVSHLIASSKAGDGLLGIQPPPAAEKLRRLMNLAQITQSHALSFFHLSAPDLLLGFDSDPGNRNVFGLAQAQPQLAVGGIRLRQLGQQIIEMLGGQKIHPAWCIPGGVRSPLEAAQVGAIRQRLPEAFATAQAALATMYAITEQYERELRSFGNFPSLYLSLVGGDGQWEHYGGRLRVVNADREIVFDDIDPSRYHELIAEAVQPSSYLKSPYLRSMGENAGMYRVGPLARLNVCDHFGTPIADAELRRFRELAGDSIRSDSGRGAVNQAFYYHHARLIEIIAALELIERLLDDPDLLSSRVQAHASVNCLRAVGCSEAPRGTLFHEYQVDAQGLIEHVNLVIATGQNNLAMNRTVTQIAKEFIRSSEIPEGMLNRVEAGIRAYDPCLSCSTHALGQMPLHIQLFTAAGTMLSERRCN